MSNRYSSIGNQGNKRKSIFTPSISNQNNQESSAQAIELERLEQEITLTLQSIDKNFAKSHRIINDKLIPIIKNYHQSSKKIGQGVEFWKSFFETSANVELRGYEEAQHDNQTTEEPSTIREDDENDGNVTLSGDDQNNTLHLNEQFSPVKPHDNHQHEFLQESTNHTIQQRYTSNFNTNQLQNFTPNRLRDNPIMPSIPQGNNLGFDTTDSIIPPIPQSANLSNTNNGTDVNQTTPTLQRTREFQQPDVRTYHLHNNLNTNLRVQISPRRQQNQKHSIVNQLTPRRQASKKRKSMIAQKFDSSPFEIETPKLTSDVQLSPVKHCSPLRKSITHEPHSNNDQDQETTQRFPHTPKYGAGGQLLHATNQISRTANRYSNQGLNQQNQPNEEGPINQFDDSETTPQLSPPITLNFGQINSTNPNLRHTPAREAAHNIVQDILNNVGGNDSGLSGFEEFGISAAAAAATSKSAPNTNKGTATQGGNPQDTNTRYNFDSTENSLFNDQDPQQDQQGQNQNKNKEIPEFDEFLDRQEQQRGDNPDWSDD